jgi:hypothetical protein
LGSEHSKEFIQARVGQFFVKKEQVVLQVGVSEMVFYLLVVLGHVRYQLSDRGILLVQCENRFVDQLVQALKLILIAANLSFRLTKNEAYLFLILLQ